MSNADKTIAIVDYQMGNLFSVQRACEQVGLRPVVTSEVPVIMRADAMILPGVGAFGDAMEVLGRLDLISPIKDFIATERPFMGICLGLQLLMSESEEFGRHRGLDIITGSVVRFPAAGRGQFRGKVPQVGWNTIYRPDGAENAYWDASPLKNVANNEYMYFVHSFYAVPRDSRVVLSRTSYEDTEYSSSVLKGNIFACQFHPEKSSAEGMKIYKNFASLVEARKGADG